MAEGEAPPSAAVRGGVSTSVFAIGIVVVAILAFVGGAFLGPVIFPGPQAVLSIATNTPFPPFEFRDESGTLVGFDIDLISEIMRRMNQEFRFVDFRDFGALLAAVQEEQVDLAASAITSSGTTGAARNETMDFSDPYFEADQTVLVRAGETPVTCAPAGCIGDDFAGVSIATQSGTTSEFWVLDFVTNPDITTFPDVVQVLQALQTSGVDVVIIDKPAGEAIAAANPAFDSLATIETNELYAFATANTDPLGLSPRINAALAEIRADGTYDQIIEDNFG